MAEDAPKKPRLVQRLEEQRDRHRNRPLVIRVLYVVAGFTVLAAGIGMLVLPGPAFIAIPIGLALLSLEFAWAEELLERALKQGEIAKRKAAETTRTQRMFTAIAIALGAAAFITWGLLADIPFVPV
ncbi:MAG: PGPGW domain-containing protein [Solirubrobacteraceae bacterium]